MSNLAGATFLLNWGTDAAVGPEHAELTSCTISRTFVLFQTMVIQGNLWELK